MTQKALKYVCLGILVLMLGIPALAQNTKGDKPVPANRETRFKTPKKTKQKRQPSRKARRGNNRQNQRVSLPPGRAREGERAGKPIAPQFGKTKAGQSERAWKGDLTGRRIRPRGPSSRAKNVYPQPDNINYSSRSRKQMRQLNDNPNIRRVRRMQNEEPRRPRVGRPIRPTYHNTRPQRRERAWKGDITGRPIRAGSSDRLRPPAGAPPSRILGSGGRPRPRRYGAVSPRVSGGGGNLYFKKRFYVNNQSRRRPRSEGRSRAALNMYQRYSGQRPTEGRAIRGMAPRTASAAYMARRSTNTWAHFPRPRRKGERAYTRDIAGKKLRTKNYETPRGVIINPTLKYQRRVPTGERAYKGRAAGSYATRTRPGRAWKGDIAHRAIRGGFRSKKGEPRPGAPLFGRGPGKGALRMGRYQGNIKGGRRGFGDQGEEYSGNIRSGRALKGGGSVTGGWNNKGQPLRGRTPGKGSEWIGYSGNIRGGRRAFNEQGEGYSGNIRRGRRGFNDQGEEYTGNIKGGRRYFDEQGEGYSGNLKLRRSAKGGGSRSGGHWNNRNTPILVRTPKGKGGGIAGYQGNIKGGRKTFDDQGEGYAGNIKARRPDKGGGSVSGKVWNNRERAIEGRHYAGQTKLSRYSGNLKARRPEKGGGSVSGKLWNNNEQAIEGKSYASQTKISRYSGNLKARRPEKGGGSVSGKLWNNNEQAIEGKSYAGQTKLSRYSGNVKVSRSAYKHNPKAADDALPTLKASAATMDAGRHTAGVRRDWNYIRNPSSADDAQRTREPGRAFGKSADFQGNIRLKKFDLFGKSDLHPDAQFVKLNRNNVPEERDVLTNFKLWWGRLFRKAETQPDHLKENDKDRRPRYDKGEAGLWYE